MKQYLFLFIIAFVCTAYLCNHEETENYHRTIKVTNNAEFPIYIVDEWLWSWYEDSEGAEYPWSPNENKIGGIGQSKNRIDPGETNTEAMKTIRASDSIESIGPNGMIKIFFIDAAAYDQIPIGSPIPNETLLSSRVYTLEDLRAINFHIVYPLRE